MNAPPPDNPDDDDWNGTERRQRREATQGTFFEVRAMRQEMRALRAEVAEHGKISAGNFHKITRLEEIILGDDGISKRLKFIVDAMPKLLMTQNIVFGAAIAIGVSFMGAVTYLIGWAKK